MSPWAKIVLLGGAVVFLSTPAHGQALPLTVTSGYNDDLIANGSGSADTSASPMDSYSSFYDSAYLSSHPGASGGAFPAGETVTGASGAQYTLASATGNNALFVDSWSTTGALTISPVSGMQTIDVLGTSANGPSTLNYTLNFAGGATYSSSLSLSDWYDPSYSGEITQLSHVTAAGGGSDAVGTYSPQGDVFSLYEATITLPTADQSDTLDSIDFTWVNGGNPNGRAAIFALSGQTVPEPGSIVLWLAALAGLVWIVRRHPARA